MLRIVFAALIAAAMLPSLATAQFTLGEKFAPYKLAVAEYKITPDDMTEHDLLWTPPPGVDWLEVGNMLIMVGPPSPTPYTVDLIVHVKRFELVTLADGSERRFIVDARINRNTRSFTVIGEVPKPPPDPDDPEPPPGDIPEGQYELIRNSYEWAMQVPVSHRRVVIDKLIINFDVASKSTAAPNVMLANLRTVNQAALPNPSAARTAWLVFFEPWAQQMTEMLADGRLANITSSHQKAFEETRKGLEFAAKETN